MPIITDHKETDLERRVLGSQPVYSESLPARYGLNLAEQLAKEEDANTAKTRDFLMGSRNKNQAAMEASLGTASQMFGKYADQASGNALNQFRGLSDYLGGAGITGGGLAAGLGAQIDLQRQGQISEGMRDISIREGERRGQMASDMFLQDLSLAPYLNQSPSMLLLDETNSLAAAMQESTLGWGQINASKEIAARASKDAKKNMWGSIGAGALQGVLGAFL